MRYEDLSNGRSFQTSSDEEPLNGGMDRPFDQASRMPLNYEMGGADEISELGTKAIRPPYSNPANGEMQSSGADQVEEIKDHAKSDWPWEGHAGASGRRAPQATD